MKINIANISDFPARISIEEKNKGLYFFDENNIDYKNYFEQDLYNNIKIINILLQNNSNENIIFSSGGFDTINNINLISNNVGGGHKVLIGFSDTLHLQAKYYNTENVYNIYGVTMRNIFELTENNKKLLFNFINNKIFQCQLSCENIGNENITGRLHGGHIMILITILDIYGLDIIQDDILYLDFHGMEKHFIQYYLDVLKNKGIFNKVSGIILDINIDNYDKSELIHYFSSNGVSNIYSLGPTHFLPFYKQVTIRGGRLVVA